MRFKKKTKHRLLQCAALLTALLLGVLWLRGYIGTPLWLERHDEAMLLPLIDEAAAKHNLPSSLVRAVIWKESRFNQFSKGSRGEIGLMQITSGAVQDWSSRTRREKPGRTELFIPEVNLEIGSWYLEQASRHWKDYASGDVLALAEYNAGYGKVSSDWAPKNPAEIVELSKITYPGTREYIRLILKKKAEYDKAGKPGGTP